MADPKEDTSSRSTDIPSSLHALNLSQPSLYRNYARTHIHTHTHTHTHTERESHVTPASSVVQFLTTVVVGKDKPHSERVIIKANGAKYISDRIVGNGSFGVVFQATCVTNDEIVAIKKVLQDKRFKVCINQPTNQPTNLHSTLQMLA
jgi:hypothetical protein